MAKLTRSNSLSALVTGTPTFIAGTDRVSIGITSPELQTTYHLHLTRAEAKSFADFVSKIAD